MLYSEWLRKVAAAVKSVENDGPLYLCHVLGNRQSYHGGTNGAIRELRRLGLFDYPEHIIRLEGQIQEALDEQERLISLGVTPPRWSSGLGVWLSHVGKTRSQWLETLSAQASPSAKAYKPTHGGYPDASRNISSHRCSRDDGVSGD